MQLDLRASHYCRVAHLHARKHLRFAAETDARVEEESAEHRGALVAATKRPPKLDSAAALLDRTSENYQDAPDTSATGEIMRDLAKNCCCDRFR